MNLQKIFLIGLIFLVACATEQRRGTSDAMTSVANTVTTNGPGDAVFALVTTARFWPQWHPATQAVGGVTERPFGLGDRIHERGRIGKLEFSTTWKVAGYERSSRVILQSEKSQTRITYTFQALDGGTVFTRNLEYNCDNFAAVAADLTAAEELMRVQSEQAVNQLKALVEKILRQESSELS